MHQQVIKNQPTRKYNGFEPTNFGKLDYLQCILKPVYHQGIRLYPTTSTQKLTKLRQASVVESVQPRFSAKIRFQFSKRLFRGS